MTKPVKFTLKIKMTGPTIDQGDVADLLHMTADEIEHSAPRTWGKIRDVGEWRFWNSGEVVSRTIHSRPTFAELEAMPRLAQGQVEDLRYDDGKVRFWTSRLRLEDGARFEHEVTVEALRDGRWIQVSSYDGDEQP